MKPDSDRWKEITPSQFPWEREALAFLRDGLPDVEPVRAWSTFEFVADDGSINEVDLLVLTAKGFFLVEIKSRPGVVDGDAATWRWSHQGKLRVIDNPRLGANRKAKKLASLLQRQKALSRLQLPFVEPLVFLSAAGLDCRLQGSAATGVWLRDRPTAPGKPGRAGILYALAHLTPEEHNNTRRHRIDRPLALAITQAIEQAGIRRSQRYRRVGEYQLERLLEEGPGYQDWQAQHVALPSTRRRVRLYPLTPTAAREKTSRELFQRAARREFQLLEGIEHPGILRPSDYIEHELGPALVFDHDETAVRLDHYLARKGAELGFDQRLDFVRQIAEVLRRAHDQRLYHRALCPRSILVRRPDSASPSIQILNWQTGTRESRSSSGNTTHLGDLVDAASSAYLAPESRTDPESRGEPLDVFSLGAIAFHLLSGQPPAESYLGLHDRLRQDHALRIDAHLDGVPASLVRLVEDSTAADLGLRLGSVDEFLRALDRIEEELTAPARKALADPTQASAGDLLGDDLQVIRRLGQGSTAVVFLVRRGERKLVLKLAFDPAQNERLRGEYEVITKLDSPRIVKALGLADIDGRAGLLLAEAGEQTLGQRLREEGPLHLDLLERFGADLLEAVAHLYDRGINHRDIKPENLGVGPVGRDNVLHLVLFDFSLARTPADNLRAGTVPYLDPFLVRRKPSRWDEYAERFAAAMTLYEMATATLPRWGDGKSDPALLDVEATLDAELFDPSVREGLSDFFRTALARDPKDRFHSAQDMRDAWRKVFARADQPALGSADGVPGDSEGAPSPLSLEGARRDTPLAALGLSARATNALGRANVLTVEHLLALPVVQVSHMRGVGNKTRKEILATLTRLAEHFADVRGPTTSSSRSDDGDAAAEPEGAPVYSIDLLVQGLVAPRAASTEARALRSLLGLDDDATAGLPPGSIHWHWHWHWPSQTDVAERLDVTRARVSQVLIKARERWRKQPALTAVRDDLAEILRARSGVMTGRELREALLAARGSAEREPQRSLAAGAVLRAAVETEIGGESPRWIIRRAGPHLLVAIDDHDGEMLADLAEQLGRRADQLVAEEPLPSPSRAVEALQAVVDKRELPPLPPARLLTLAAAASTGAAVSPRLELYPRSLDPARALKLARGALLGVGELGVEDIRARVRARYPEMDKEIPGRPELDQLLAEAGWELAWSPSAGGGQGAYRATLVTFTSLTSGPTSLPRYPTAIPPITEISPEIEEAQAVEDKLERARAEGGLLILSVSPTSAERAQRELQTRFGVEAYSVEAALLRHLKAFAAENDVDWSVVLRADAAPHDSEDWRNLQYAVGTAVAHMLDELRSAPRPLLLTRPGLLARYERLDLIETLRRALEGPPPPAPPSSAAPAWVWVLVPSDDRQLGPRLDGRAVPVLTPAHWRRLPEAWIKNQHRTLAL